MKKQSFLIRKKEEKVEQKLKEVVLGINVSFAFEDGDLAINAKVRTRKDLERLKIIINEMIDELLEKHEEQRVSTTPSRGFRRKN